jgi:hypothetical protein
MPDYQAASRLFKSQKQLNAKLQIFRSQGNQSPEKWKFETTKKPTLNQIITRSNALKVGVPKKLASRTRAR